VVREGLELIARSGSVARFHFTTGKIYWHFVTWPEFAPFGGKRENPRNAMQDKGLGKLVYITLVIASQRHFYDPLKTPRRGYSTMRSVALPV